MGFRQTPRSLNKASCPSRGARAAGLARLPVAPWPKNRRRHTLPVQDHRYRRAKAARWDGAKFRQSVAAAYSPRKAVLGPGLYQLVHLGLVDLLLAFFFQSGFQAGNEQLNRFIAFVADDLITEMVFLFLEFRARSGGILPLGNGKHHTARADVDGTADLARLQSESDACRAGHGSDARDVGSPAHKFAGLHRGPGFFGGLAQIVLLMCMIREFLDFLLQQGLDALGFEIRSHFVANLVPNVRPLRFILC